MNFTKQCLKYGRSKLNALMHLTAFAYFFLVQSAGVTLNMKVLPGIKRSISCSSRVFFQGKNISDCL